MITYSFLVGLLLLTVAQASSLKKGGLSPGIYVVDSKTPTLRKLSTELNFENGKVHYHECNWYNCQFSEIGNRIKISRCISTLMFCPGSLEHKLSDILSKVDSF